MPIMANKMLATIIGSLDLESIYVKYDGKSVTEEKWFRYID